jgi:hypothetical protein
MRVELRITFNLTITAIGEGAASALFPWYTVEEML